MNEEERGEVQPNGSRFRAVAITVAKVVVSVVLLASAFSLLQFSDEERLVLQGGEEVAATSVREEGERLVLTLPSGGERTIAKAARLSQKRFEGLPTILRKTDKTLLLLCLIAMLVPQIFLAIRWWLLLRLQRLDVRFLTALRLNYIGLFFNNILPGATGGDIAKAVITAGSTERKAAAVGTVLADRVIGLVSVVLMATLFLTMNLRHRELLPVAPVIYGVAFLMICLATIYFSPWFRGTGVAAFLKGILPYRGVLKEADEVFLSIYRRKTLLLQCLLLSFVAQASTILIQYGLVRSLSFDNIEIYHMFVYISMIFVISALPISIGGLGVGEMTYVWFFASAGLLENESLALALLYRLCMLFSSLPGGALFLIGLWKSRRRKA